MGGFILDIQKAVAGDLGSVIRDQEKGIYRYVLPCNPKAYSISGLQHFFGTAFVATRLAEFAGMDECEQAVAFLAGLLHDYEKMGLRLQDLTSKLSDVLGADTKTYETLDRYICGKWSDAVEIASKLEGGGLPRRLQLIAEFVRLGDYLTGGEESWNIVYVMDTVKKSLDKLGVKHYLAPIVVGKQRPLIAMIASKLEESLESSGMTPLASTSTGMLALSKTPIDNSMADKLYDSLTQYIIELSTVRSKTTVKTTAIKLDVVNKILDVSTALLGARDEDEKKSLTNKLSNALGNVKTLHMLKQEDLDTAKMLAQTPEDKKRLSLYLILSIARTVHGKADEKSIAVVANEVGLRVHGSKEELIQQISKQLENAERVDSVLEKLMDMAKKHMSELGTGKEVVESVSRILRKTISIGFATSLPVAEESVGEGTCARCRSSLKRLKETLYEQLQIEQKVTNVGYADVFHPDKQGKPEKATSMDGSAKKLFVCPVCFFESKVFTEVTGFLDGMWASSIVYYPAVSTDLLRVIKDVARNYPALGIEKRNRRKKTREEAKEVLVIPDYVTARIIVKTSDDRGRLTKQNLLDAIDLWYYLGGNLILTTSVLSAPPPWSGLPFEMESSDVVIEEVVAKFTNELAVAKQHREWSRTRMLRLILYRQLKTYVENLEQAEIKLGRSRFLKSGLVVSNAPALDVYSLVLRKHL